MANPGEGIPSKKAQLRAQIRAQRAATSPAIHADRDAAIAVNAEKLFATQPPGARIACYLSAPTEPGTNELVRALLDRGFEVIAPRVRGSHLDWAVVTAASSFETGSFGIREVNGPSVGLDTEPLRSAELVFVPALAIDHAGVRLGQGGGFYDRTLEHLVTGPAGGPLLIGVINQDELYDELPAEDHDRLVAAALSQTSITYLPTETRHF